MVRCGQLCRTCTNECRDDKNVFIECPNCRGASCEHCTDGRIRLAGCPQREIDPECITLFELFEKGVMPVAGGVLDQAGWFVKAQRLYQYDVDTIKAGHE